MAIWLVEAVVAITFTVTGLIVWYTAISSAFSKSPPLTNVGRELPANSTLTTAHVNLDLTPHIKNSNLTVDVILENVHLPSWYDYHVWQTPYFDPSANDLKAFADSKSQFKRPEDDEDEIVMKHFFSGMRNGLVLEMGALDGVSKSVSHPMEMLFGWRSVLLEADPSFAKEMCTTRPQAISMNAAVCNTPRVVHFVRGGPIDSVGTVVELVPKPWFIRRFHKQLLKDGEIDPDAVAALPEVMCVPLGPILKALGIRHIDFMMLDCEGCEEETLRSMDLDEVTIDVLAVETKRDDQDITTDKIIDAVSKASKRETYEVWNRQMGRNTWFVRKGFVRHTPGSL